MSKFNLQKGRDFLSTLTEARKIEKISKYVAGEDPGLLVTVGIVQLKKWINKLADVSAKEWDLNYDNPKRKQYLKDTVKNINTVSSNMLKSIDKL